MSTLVYWSFAIALTPWVLDLVWYLLSSAEDLARSRTSRDVRGRSLDLLDSAVLNASNPSRKLGWVASLEETANRWMIFQFHACAACGSERECAVAPAV